MQRESISLISLENIFSDARMMETQVRALLFHVFVSPSLAIDFFFVAIFVCCLTTDRSEAFL